MLVSRRLSLLSIDVVKGTCRTASALKVLRKT
jgi:hypothetical protein